MADTSENRKYEGITKRSWSAQDVQSVLSRDASELFGSLPSIMQDNSSTALWKVSLALELLRELKVDALRARVWDSVAIPTRMAQYSDFAALADLAWSVLDAFKDEHSTTLELVSVQDFLSDLRTHAFDAVPGFPYETTNSDASTRFEVFNHIRAMCCYGNVNIAGLEIVRLADDDDFVIRESAVNGISVLYSRPDYGVFDLKEWIERFRAVLNKRESDTHWYVRKSCSTASFFENEILQELAKI